MENGCFLSSFNWLQEDIDSSTGSPDDSAPLLVILSTAVLLHDKVFIVLLFICMYLVYLSTVYSALTFSYVEHKQTFL